MAARYCPLSINIFFLTSCSTIACSSESWEMMDLCLSTAGPVPVTLPVWALCRQRASSTLQHISLGLHLLHHSNWAVWPLNGYSVQSQENSLIEMAGFRVIELIWVFPHSSFWMWSHKDYLQCFLHQKYHYRHFIPFSVTFCLYLFHKVPHSFTGLLISTEFSNFGSFLMIITLRAEYDPVQELAFI